MIAWKLTARKWRIGWFLRERDSSLRRADQDDPAIHKSVEQIKGIHEAQLLTSMKHAALKVGLLINFNVTKRKDGIKRFVL